MKLPIVCPFPCESWVKQSNMVKPNLPTSCWQELGIFAPRAFQRGTSLAFRGPNRSNHQQNLAANLPACSSHQRSGCCCHFFEQIQPHSGWGIWYYSSAGRRRSLWSRSNPVGAEQVFRRSSAPSSQPSWRSGGIGGRASRGIGVLWIWDL